LRTANLFNSTAKDAGISKLLAIQAVLADSWCGFPERLNIGVDSCFCLVQKSARDYWGMSRSHLKLPPTPLPLKQQADREDAVRAN